MELIAELLPQRHQRIAVGEPLLQFRVNRRRWGSRGRLQHGPQPRQRLRVDSVRLG